MRCRCGARMGRAVGQTGTLQLAASDGFMTAADRAIVTVDQEPSLTGAALAIALGSVGPLSTGPSRP